MLLQQSISQPSLLNYTDRLSIPYRQLDRDHLDFSSSILWHLLNLSLAIKHERKMISQVKLLEHRYKRISWHCIRFVRLMWYYGHAGSVGLLANMPFRAQRSKIVPRTWPVAL
jgi:hypothetical protein